MIEVIGQNIVVEDGSVQEMDDNWHPAEGCAYPAYPCVG